MIKLRVPDLRPLKTWIILHRRQLLLYGGGGIVALIVITQLLYPGDRLLPLAQVDGVNVGWRTRDEATKMLNSAYSNYELPIYMGNDTKPTVSPTLQEVSIGVDNTNRVHGMDYPWYLRLVPSSIFWAQYLMVGKTPTPTFANDFVAYIDSKLMPECRQAPFNASLKANGNSLDIVSAQDGGSCERDSVIGALKAVRPNLTHTSLVRVAQQQIAPAVGNAVADSLRTRLRGSISAGIPLTVNNETVTIAAKDVYGWLDFTVQDTALVATINAERAGSWLAANVSGKVAITPGVSYIKTLDFTEISRTDGTSGLGLDIPTTIASLQRVINGDGHTAAATTVVVPPTEQYTRTYSPTDAGLSALLSNYAKDHTGTFGISFAELDGKKRRADYQGDKQFVTASTYKLFAAYSVLKRIDAGTMSWSDEETCFDKMISYSDNACAETYLDRIGLGTITKEIQAIGLKNSTFMVDGGPYTTANDLALLLGMLQSQQNFSAIDRERLIGAMKANVYRNGIPAGVNSVVADKVGFLDALLHDAAIVYSPNGTYVLTIMTDGSSWATIADLAKQIDTLHSQ